MHFLTFLSHWLDDLEYMKLEYDFARQLLRSETSIGISVKDSPYLDGGIDFNQECSIVLKGANECNQRINMSYHSIYITQDASEILCGSIQQLVRFLFLWVKLPNWNLNFNIKYQFLIFHSKTYSYKPASSSANRP